MRGTHLFRKAQEVGNACAGEVSMGREKSDLLVFESVTSSLEIQSKRRREGKGY